MAEIVGRIEQLALMGGGHQQITGQPQVEFCFLIEFSLNRLLFFSREQMVLHRMYRLMLLVFKISIEFSMQILI